MLVDFTCYFKLKSIKFSVMYIAALGVANLSVHAVNVCNKLSMVLAFTWQFYHRETNASI